MKKQFVRALSALLCLILCAFAAPAVSADDLCEFTLSSVTVPEHARTVTIKLSVNAPSPIAGADFRIDLPEGVSFVSASSKLSGGKISFAADENGDVICDLDASGAPVSGEAVLATVVISLPDEKKTGDRMDLSLVVEEGDVYSPSGTEIETALFGSSVTVEGEVMYGDVNCDCAVNARDVTLTMKRMTETPLSQYFDVKAADVNLDNKLNAKDVTALMKSLTGSATVRLGHHDLIEVLEAANCKQKGKARLTCTECGDSVVVETPLGPHDYVLGVCSVCGAFHPDRAITVYTDFLRRNGTLETALRGFAIYKTVTLSQYKLFESNICDSKSGELVIYGVATFDNGLVCYVSVEMEHVGAPYTFHYDAEANGKIIAAATGTLSADMKLTFTETTGMPDSKVSSHLKIAQSVANNMFAYTADMLEGAGTGLTLADFGLTK